MEFEKKPRFVTFPLSVNEHLVSSEWCQHAFNLVYGILLYIQLEILGRITCVQCTSCGLLLQMSHIAWSVCLCVFLCVGHTGERWAKRLSRPRCRFFWGGGWLLWVQGTMCSMGSSWPRREGALLREDICRPSAWERTYALRMCLPSARGEWIHSSPRGVTRGRCGLLPSYFGHWFKHVTKC